MIDLPGRICHACQNVIGFEGGVALQAGHVAVAGSAVLRRPGSLRPLNSYTGIHFREAGISDCVSRCSGPAEYRRPGHDKMIGLPGRICHACQNVIGFEGRVILQDFGMVGPCAEKLQNIDDAHPGSAQARPTTALAGFDCDTFEQFGYVVHDFSPSLTALTSISQNAASISETTSTSDRHPSGGFVHQLNLHEECKSPKTERWCIVPSQPLCPLRSGDNGSDIEVILS